jgi:protein SCO1/2
MKALLLAILFGVSCVSGGEDHPAPAADAVLPQGSLYALDATWTRQTGEKVEWKKSAGTVRVIALGYATCKGVCPRIIADMQRIEQGLPAAKLAGCRFTFVSLDPAHDKVPEMKALGERHKVDDARWDLLTGDEDAVLDLAVALGVRYDRLPNGIDFAHSYLIAVIGPDGRLLHKWAEPAEGAEPSLEEIRKAMKTGEAGQGDSVER